MLASVAHVLLCENFLCCRCCQTEYKNPTLVLFSQAKREREISVDESRAILLFRDEEREEIATITFFLTFPPRSHVMKHISTQFRLRHLAAGREGERLSYVLGHNRPQTLSFRMKESRISFCASGLLVFFFGKMSECMRFHEQHFIRKKKKKKSAAVLLHRGSKLKAEKKVKKEVRSCR